MTFKQERAANQIDSLFKTMIRSNFYDSLPSDSRMKVEMNDWERNRAERIRSTVLAKKKAEKDANKLTSNERWLLGAAAVLWIGMFLSICF